MFLLYIIWENKLIGSADDSTLMAVVPPPGIRIKIAESLKHNLINISERCHLWGIKLNVSETKTMIVFQPCTMHPQSPPVTSGRTVLKETDVNDIMGVPFDSKMIFYINLC